MNNIEKLIVKEANPARKMYTIKLAIEPLIEEVLAL